MAIWSRVLKGIRGGQRRRSVPIPRFEPLEPRMLLSAQIMGTVWNDLDGNGLKDTGEPGIPGLTVYLDSGQTATTDSNGVYQFKDLIPGTYRVGQVLIPGFSQTYPIQAGLVNQQHLWAWSTQGMATSKADATAVRTDAQGNVYVAGTFEGTVDLTQDGSNDPITSAGASDVFISKLSSDGSGIWTKVIAGTHGLFGETVTDMIIAPSGKIYLVGGFGSNVDFDPGPGVVLRSATSYRNGYLLALNQDGSFDSVRTFGGTGQVTILGMDMDPAGNIYLTGTFSATIDFDPGDGSDLKTAATNATAAFITRINADGSYAWTRVMGGDYYTRGIAVRADRSGNVYVTGIFSGTVDFDPGPGVDRMTYAGDWDIFISKFSSNGDYIWTRRMGGSDWDMVHQMRIDPAGSIYLAGLFSGYADLDPTAGSDYRWTHNHVGAGFLTKLNPDGTYAWSQVFGSTDLRWAATDISLDLAGNTYVVGERMALPEYAGVDPNSDLFISKVGPDGRVIWTQTINDIININTQSDYTPWQWNVTATADGQLLVCGRFGRAVDLDTGQGIDTRTPTGQYEAFVIRQRPISYTHSVSLADGQTATGIDFGNKITGGFENLEPVVTRFRVHDPDASEGYATNRQVQVELDAIDIAGSIHGWMITESQIPPAASDPAWSATKPTTYTIIGPGDGPKTLYAWVKDDQGAVSALTSISQAQLTLDTSAPTVTVTPQITPDATPPLTGTVDDPQATVRVNVNGHTYLATNDRAGHWYLADDSISDPLKSGTYDVRATATDLAGNQGQDPTSNELIIQVTPPTASITVTDVTVPGSGHTFAVTYRSSIGIDAASLDDLDILVTGPNGFSQIAELVGLDSAPSHTEVVATYRITAPRGLWAEIDNGVYTVSIRDSQVKDLDVPAHYVPSGVLGQFTVDVVDTPPEISIANASITEGDDGSQVLQFTVNLSWPSATVVTADYSTLSGSATQGSDYVAAEGTITFLPGQTSQVVEVGIIGDKRYEADEIFYIRLSNLQNCTLQDGEATGTIINDDAAPLPPAEYFDGRLGDYFDLRNKALWFTPDQTGTGYTTQIAPLAGTLPTNPDGGTQLALTDNDSIYVPLGDGKTVRIFGQEFHGVYVGTNGYLTFTDRDTDSTESLADHFRMSRISGLFVDLVARSDSSISYKQLSDRFVVTWQNMGQPTIQGSRNTFQIEIYFDGRIQIAWLSVYSAKGIVGLSDGQGIRPGFSETDLSSSDPIPSISITDASIDEGDSGNTYLEFQVQLSVPIGLDVEVEYNTIGITATAGEDFTPVSGRLTIPAGHSVAVVRIPILGDTRYEYDETLRLELSNARYAVIEDAQGLGTIRNDDPIVPPVIDSFHVQGTGSVPAGYANNRHVAVTITEHDPDGTVVAWAITESPTPPALDADIWQSTRPAQYNISSTGDGLKTLYAWAKDNHGAISSLTPSSQAQIILDTTAPVVTVDPLTTKDRNPQLTGTVDDLGAAVKVTVAGKTYTATNLGNGTWFLADNLITPLLPDGAHDVQAKATDHVGNVGNDQTTDELIVDYANPSLQGWGPMMDTGVDGADKVTKAVPVVLNFQFNEPIQGLDSDVTILAPDGTSVRPDVITGWGTANLRVVLTNPYQDGQYTVRLSGTITDIVGNQLNGGEEIVLAFTLDRQSPGISQWALQEAQPGTADPVVTTDQSPVITIRFSEAVYGSSQDVKVIGPDGSIIDPEVAGLGTDTIVISFPQPLTKAGLYRVTLKASGTITDQAGNAINNGIDLTIPFNLQLPILRMGSEFLVPSASASDQFMPAVASDGNGMFIAAWYSRSATDPDVFEVYIRRFDATGTALGQQQLASIGSIRLPGLPDSPAIAVSADGRFAVAWEAQVGILSQVQLRIFAPDGTPISGIITIGGQYFHCYRPDLAFDPTTGQILVTYTRQDDGLVVPGDLYGTQIYLQRYDLDGTAQGTAIQVSSTAGKASKLAVDPSGRILVIWNGKQLTDRFLIARFIDASGQLGPEFKITQIDNLSDGLLQTTSIAMDGQGRFVVAWDEPFLQKVFVRQFDADGQPIGQAFELAGANATEPDVAIDTEGNFIVTWSNTDRDGDGCGVYARRFNPDGSTSGPDLRVNSQVAGEQSQPALAIGPWGRVLVCWSSLDPGSIGTDVKGQILDYLPPNVTVDSIITEDLSPALSGTVDEPDAAVYVSVRGASFQAINNGDGTWTLGSGNISLPTADGAYDVVVKAIDPAGNVGTDQTTGELILDREDPVMIGQPALIEDTGSPTDRFTGDTTPTVVFTFSEPVYGTADAIQAWVRPVSTIPGYYEPRVDITPDAVEGWGTNQISVRFTTPLTINGEYTIKLIAAQVKDRAGKPVNDGSDIYTGFRLDCKVPQVMYTSLTTSSPYPDLEGYVDDPFATVRVRIGNVIEGVANVEYETGNWTCSINQRLVPGQYEVVVTATDSAGNVGTATGTLTILMAEETFDNESNSWDVDWFFSRWQEVFEGDKDVPKPAPAGQTRSWGPDAAEVMLTQISNIYSSSSDPLARKGTYLLFKPGSTWTDYRVSYTMASEDDGDIGLMFRVKDANNYYRFSWHRATGERRLVKCVDGRFTLLASDKANMDKGTFYDIQVLAHGSLLEVYVDEKLIFAARDTSITSGTIAFYCHSNNRAFFDDMQVENLAGVNLPPRFTQMEASANRIFDTQTVQLHAQAYDPDEGRPITYLWVLDEGQGQFDDPTSPNPVFTPANISEDMTCVIHVEASDGAVTTKSKAIQIEVFDADKPVFLEEDFQEVDPNEWVIKDVSKTASVWTAVDGTLRQKTSATSFLTYLRGSIWQAVQIEVDLSSSVDGAMGVVFRYQDENNYYRFLWNNNDGTRRLQVCINGQVTDLASDKAKYTKKQVYKLSIIALGPFIAVDINGQRIFTVTDTRLTTGTAGLYVSNNKGASFDNLVVRNFKDADLAPVITSAYPADYLARDGQPLGLTVEAYDPDGDDLTYHWSVVEGAGTFDDADIANPRFTPDDVTRPTQMKLAVEVSDGTHRVTKTVDITVLDSDAPLLLDEDFNDGDFNGWSIVNQGNRNTPSGWSATSGQMVQTSKIYRASDGIARRGTFAKYLIGSVWTDYEVSVQMMSSSNGHMGLMFRVKDNNNYYRFAMGPTGMYLVSCKAGRFTTLASNATGYTANQVYQVRVAVLGPQIRVYVDGSVVFAVTDTSITAGTIALYSYANAGSYFDDIRVVSHTGQDLVPVVNSISASPSAITHNRTSQLNVDVTEPDGQILTYQWYVEPGQGTLSSTSIPNPIYTPPQVAGTQVFTLTVDISDGAHILRRTVDITVSEPRVLLQDDFNDGDYTGWTIVDQGDRLGPSAWSVQSGQLVEDSGIYKASDGIAKRGTFASYASGAAWTNYEASVLMQSTSTGEMGLMFRVKDNNNYYRFAMGPTGMYLVRCKAGRFTTLASNATGYVAGQVYQVRVLLVGPQMKVYVDGSEVFSVTDTNITAGTIALYSYANAGSRFDDVLVKEVI